MYELSADHQSQLHQHIIISVLIMNLANRIVGVSGCETWDMILFMHIRDEGMRSCMTSALFTFKMLIIRRPGYACTCHTCYQEHMIDYPVLFQVFILHLETNIFIHCELQDGKLEDKPGMSSMRSVMQTTLQLNSS